MNSVIVFTFYFLFIFLIMALLLSISQDWIFSHAISGAASAISNVGPGLGDVIGPNGNYKEIPDIIKMDIVDWNASEQIRAVCCSGFILPCPFGGMN